MGKEWWQSFIWCDNRQLGQSCPKSELVSLYLLNKISVVIDLSNGDLHKDDSLAVFQNNNGPRLHALRKNIIATLKKG